MSTDWSLADVPDQKGRVAVVTGANTGIGFHTAAVLADRGAHVVLAVRDLVKGSEAATRICAASPHADVALQRLDLASLESARAAVDDLKSSYPRIDLLINNAGVMLTPKAATQDGFELQFGTNHLGHFAFTGLLLDALLQVAGSRVVTVTSLGHWASVSIDFDELHGQRRYRRMLSYSRSKLANLLFTYALQRRLAEDGASTIAVAAHPGASRTGLVRNSPWWLRASDAVVAPVIFQSAQMGSLPILRAATGHDVRGGQFYGPGGFGQLRGTPRLVRSSAHSHNEELQRRLWAVSEQLTGVSYPV